MMANGIPEDMGTKVTGLTNTVVEASQLCSGRYITVVYNNDCIMAHNGKECDILESKRYFDTSMAIGIR
jgi:hypothetical protein